MTKKRCKSMKISGGPDRTRICDLYRVKVAFVNELRAPSLKTNELAPFRVSAHIARDGFIARHSPRIGGAQ